jgi:cytidylate kinase
MTQLAPVITIDGPGGTGKGTVSLLLAQELAWHYLDSGTLYRVLAYAAVQQGISLQNEDALAELANSLPIQFIIHDRVVKASWNDQDISEPIRSESCSQAASTIAILPMVREGLLSRQRAFRKWPGLVTDGRDMGTIIFPDAPLKFFLTASQEERARRRYQQLKTKGIHASLETVLQDLMQRDSRDTERSVAPLKPAPDAMVIDTTRLTVEQVLEILLQKVKLFLST